MAKYVPKHRRQPPKRRRVLGVGLAVLACSSVAATGAVVAAGGISAASHPRRVVASTTTTTTVPAATDVAGPNPFTSPAIARFLATRTNVVSAAVCDLSTGTLSQYHPGLRQFTASMVKLDILLELLVGAEQRHEQVPAATLRLARSMITTSDNDAATALFNALGGPTALDAFNARLGLTSTTSQWNWGATLTTPADQIALLRLVVLPNTVLSTSTRDLAMSLLEGVVPAQRFGIGSGPPAGSAVGLKDGWFPEVATGWQINSAGFVLLGNTWYLAAIQTGHNPSKQYGLDTVNTLGRLLWRYERFGKYRLH